MASAKINISACSLRQLARHIRQGRLSSVEVVSHFISIIEKTHPQLNAVVVQRFPQALKRASQADQALARGESWGKLHGVPITIKECLDWVGTPSTFGLPSRKDDFPTKNDPYIQALLDEGAIILGKTNVAQLLAYFEADNPLYGRTQNPLHPDFSPGGSSGGSGAIVAAGGSPLGIGTDLGGSVRVPAAFCGIMGLKPTMQRNYDFARLAKNWDWQGINSVVGPLARQVGDLALAGEILGSIPNPAQPQPHPFPDYQKVDVASLRIGYYTSDSLFPATPAIQDGIREIVRELEGRGIPCQAMPAYRPKEAEALHTQFNSRDGARLFLDSLGNDRPSRQLRSLIPLMRMPAGWVHALGKVAGWLGQESIRRMSAHFGKTSKDLPMMLERLAAYRQGYLEMMDVAGIDAILSPVNALPGYLHGTSIQLGNAGTYTLTHNVTGFPAGVVPLGKIQGGDVSVRPRGWDSTQNLARKVERKSQGLPIAVQVAARPWREDVVLAVMDVVAGGEAPAM